MIHITSKLSCGAAIANITPTEFPFPRGGNSHFGGVVDPLCVRVIALSDGENKALIVSFDLAGAPDPQKNLKLISERTGIPEENILYIATHAHATPFVGSMRHPMGGNPEARTAETMKAYEERVYSSMFSAIDAAIASMRPAKYGIGNGKSYINVNRNQDYVSFDAEGNRIIKCGVGYNAEGPTDKTLFAMRFEDYDGNPIAFFINYPVHCVVMHENDCFNGAMGISGDIAGNVSQFMEKKFDKAVAIWSSGAAGDQNPIMMNQLYYPDSNTGEFVNEVIPGGESYMLKVLSTRHYNDVLRTLEKIDRFYENAEIGGMLEWSYTPGRDTVMNNPAQFDSAYTVTTEGAAPYDVRLHLLKIGNAALLGISGELYMTHALHLKEISPLKNTVIVTHDAGHLARSGYIYDDDGIAREALHHNHSRILPGYVKESLSKVTLNMFEKLM